jgi:hypothetical protein
MVLRLPERGRPRNVHYKKCAPGVDLPAAFIYSLKGLDSHLWPVFHPYRIAYDDAVNEYTGPLDDPRYPIVENSGRYGELVFGHVYTDGGGRPTPDGTWHVWRWVDPWGAWAHVINLDSKDVEYLNLVVKRLYLADQYNQKYGFRGYQRMMEEMDLARRAKIQDDKADLMNEISKTNQDMLRRVADNLMRKESRPTNPTKDVIMSGAGLNKRSKITRPITDREGGLILPDDM